LLITGALLSGCSVNQVDPWNSLATDRQPSERPLPLGSFPFPDEVHDDRIVYRQAGVEALEIYREAAEANTAIAERHADQVDEYAKAVDHLVDAGRGQKRIADLRQEILEEERRHWFWERTSYWVALLVLGVAAAQ
jgi:hypothetical protein